jgi:hypothetical protein
VLVLQQLEVVAQTHLERIVLGTNLCNRYAHFLGKKLQFVFMAFYGFKIP